MIAEDEKSLLTTVGDRKSLATCGDYQNFDNFCGDVRILHDFLGKNEDNSDDLYWGIKTWEASTGEIRTRISVLLGIPLWEEYLFRRGNQELGLYANLLGIIEKLRWGIRGSLIVFHRGLRFEILDSAGEEV